MNEILSNVNASSPGVKEEDDENDDDDDEDLEDHEMETKKSSASSEINPERLKAFNVSKILYNNSPYSVSAHALFSHLR